MQKRSLGWIALAIIVSFIISAFYNLTQRAIQADELKKEVRNLQKETETLEKNLARFRIKYQKEEIKADALEKKLAKIYKNTAAPPTQSGAENEPGDEETRLIRRAIADEIFNTGFNPADFRIIDIK